MSTKPHLERVEVSDDVEGVLGPRECDVQPVFVAHEADLVVGRVGAHAGDNHDVRFGPLKQNGILGFNLMIEHDQITNEMPVMSRSVQGVFNCCFS